MWLLQTDVSFFHVKQDSRWPCSDQVLLLLFTCQVVSNSLRPHGLQHARLPCLSPSPRVCSNSCPLSRWYHPTISSSVTPFSSCPQSFSAPGSFPVSQLHIRRPKYWSFSISPSNEYSRISFRIDWLDLLAVQGTVKNLLQHHSSKASVLQHSAFFMVQQKEQWPSQETEPTKLENNKNTQSHQLSSARGCPLPKPPWSKPGLNWAFLKRNYLFIYWLHWGFIAAAGFLQLQQAGTTLWLQHEGTSLWCLLLSQSTGSRACGLQ